MIANTLRSSGLFVATAFAIGVAAATSLDQLTGSEATAGLKAALDKGAASAVTNLGRPDGFWANPKVKIRLPENLRRTRSALPAPPM